MYFLKKTNWWEIVFLCSYLSVGAAPGVGQGELVEEGGAVAAVSQVERGPVQYLQLLISNKMNKHISRTMFRLCRRQPPRSRNPVTFFYFFSTYFCVWSWKLLRPKKSWNNYCARSSVAKGDVRENRLLLVTFFLNLSYLRTILSLGGGGGGRGLYTQENWTCFFYFFRAKNCTNVVSRLQKHILVHIRLTVWKPRCDTCN